MVSLRTRLAALRSGSSLASMLAAGTLLLGCPSSRSGPGQGGASPAATSPTQTQRATAGVFGAVRAVRVRSLDAGNLTRTEAVLQVEAIANDVDVSDRVWVSAFDADASPATTVPIATARAGSPLATGPGRFRLVLRYRESPLIQGEGTVEPIEVGPAERLALRTTVEVPAGVVQVRALRHGRAVVQPGRVAVWRADASRQDPPLVDGLGSDQPIRMGPGAYRLEVCEQDPGQATTSSCALTQVEVRAGETVRAPVQFGPSTRRVFPRIIDRSGMDLTDDCQLWRDGEATTQARAASDGIELPVGRQSLHVRVRRAPGVDYSEQVTLRIRETGGAPEVVLGLALGRLMLVATNQSGAPLACEAVLQQAEHRVTSETNRELVLPSGTWNATVRCRGADPVSIPGIRLPVGQTRRQRVPTLG